MVSFTSGTSVDAVPAELASYIEIERRRADVVGAAVAVFDRDRVTYAGGFGYADLARGERVTPDTLFRAASISKLFTTTLVFQEIEAGRLTLDDWINRYLDPATQIRDASGVPTDVTVRHILTHTSGLPVSWKGLQYGNLLMRHAVSGVRLPRTLAEVVAGQRTVRPAGERIVYSNGGFALLGHLVATRSRRPFPDVVRERVLAPLGMTRSSFPVEVSGPGIATAYGGSIAGGAGRKPAPYVRNLSGPAGALLTSARELAQFGRMVLRGGELDGVRLLSESTLADATRLHVRNHPDLDRGWGLGFDAGVLRGRRVAGHSGGLPGVATHIALQPDDGLGVVVLTNGGDAGFVGRVYEHCFEVMHGDAPEPIPGAPSGIPASLERPWRTFTTRVTGRYKMVDLAPPGVVSLAMGLLARPRLSHVAGGVLALDGTGYEPGFAYPDGEVGRYRLAHPAMNGARLVIEERADGVHAWASILHLRKAT